MENILKKFFKKEKAKLITHPHNFHLDDIFAAATLGILMDIKNIPYEIIRTRDEVELDKYKKEARSISTLSWDGISKSKKKPVFVFDVGEEYEEKNNLFDHHQKSCAGVRKNGIEYSSFGLVWKKYGETVCKNKEIAAILDDKIVIGIDANDTGVDVTASLQSFNLYNYISFVNSFLPTSGKKEDYDTAFIELVNISKRVLLNEISRTEKKIEDKKIFSIYFEKYKNEKVLWVEESISIPKHFSKNQNILLTVGKKEENFWIITTTEKEKNSKKAFIKMPEDWGGLKDADLEKASGIKNVGFCHKGLWMCSAKSKFAAEKMVEKILENIKK